MGLLAILALIGCEASTNSVPAFDGGAPDSTTLDADLPPMPDASTDASTDAGVDAQPPRPEGVAPANLVPDATAEVPSLETALAPGESRLVRVEVGASEHVGFGLFFDPSDADVVMYVDRFDGTGESELGLTDGGPGVRFLAVFEPEGARTHWVRIEAGADAFTGTLSIVHTPFEDGAHCLDDCDHLLQLPLPRDPAVDGYRWIPSTVLRYWFGRRDLLMMLRHAGQTMSALGHEPFEPGDLSQWDGETPGTDRGAPRHASHQRGKDVDITLYGDDGRAFWRSYCDTFAASGGRECLAGTAHGLDGETDAILYGAMLESGRVTMSFLDRELIPIVSTGAETANAAGLLPVGVLPLYTDGHHLQHWPNHDNHIHVRVSEGPYTATALSLPFAFEPP